MVTNGRVQSLSWATRVKTKLFGNGIEYSPTLVGEIRPGIPDKKDADRLYDQMQLCLTHGGGEVRMREQTIALGGIYEGLNAEGQTRFLHILADCFGLNHAEIKKYADALLKADKEGDMVRIEGKLQSGLVSPRRRILQQFLSLPEGCKFLVDMRARLQALKPETDPKLQGLDQDMRGTLTSVFDVGLLKLARITKDAPVELLDKLRAYEKVHHFDSPEDVRTLVTRDDRRVFAYFHPRMEGEPLMVLQVKLARGIPAGLQEIRGQTVPVTPPEQANTAVFDSISNGLDGLSGIPFGDFLIKRAAMEIAKEHPNIKQFVTLSPVPAFRKWLEPKLEAGDETLLLPKEIEAIHKLAGDAASGNAARELKHMLESDFPNSRALSDKLKPILKRLSAQYLLLEKRGKGNDALDPVARFHLRNGAQVERINWQGDVSSEGMKRSWGMTVNYLYDLRLVDKNHEDYAHGVITASPEVSDLAYRTERSAAARTVGK